MINSGNIIKFDFRIYFYYIHSVVLLGKVASLFTFKRIMIAIMNL